MAGNQLPDDDSHIDDSSNDVKTTSSAAYRSSLPTRSQLSGGGGTFCQKESRASLLCLEENNYDKERCQDAFEAFRRCKAMNVLYFLQGDHL